MTDREQKAAVKAFADEQKDKCYEGYAERGRRNSRSTGGNEDGGRTGGGKSYDCP